jgi:hypothetical protein
MSTPPLLFRRYAIKHRALTRLQHFLLIPLFYDLSIGHLTVVICPAIRLDLWIDSLRLAHESSGLGTSPVSDVTLPLV